MNIKISKEENSILDGWTYETILIGSRFYGTNREKSDFDYLKFYVPQFSSKDICHLGKSLSVNHLFQFDDVENNAQYIYTTHHQFTTNLYSGESTVNAEVVLWYLPMTLEERLTVLRTHKIIKGMIGRAKTDIKMIGTSKDSGNRNQHASRCLYMAEELLSNNLPKLDEILKYQDLDKDNLNKTARELKKALTLQFDSGKILSYPRLKSDNSLVQKQYDSLNIKEWKYE